MSSGQARVLGLLMALLGLQVLLNPTFRANLVGELQGKSPASIAGYLGWGAGALVLVGLADPAPMAATWIVTIFIVITLLTHAQGWAGALTSATAAMQSLTGSGTSEPANSGAK